MADVTFEKFGGLNLVQDPQEAGAEQAISCLNVVLDRNGRLRSRDGYTVAYSSALAGSPLAIHPVSSDTVLAAFAANKVRAIDISAGSSSAEVNLTGSSSSFASAGTGVYFTDGTATSVQKFAGGAFSTPAGLAAGAGHGPTGAGYEGNYLAVQPLEDRLVIADANTTSRLWFSNAGDPETITYSAGPPETGDFVELTPGDGEPITGMAVFGTELFVFKQTKFFVFYGNSTDSTGGAVFNYRMVDTGVGCVASNSAKLIASHETGVYFVGHNGVYVTTGGPPRKVSGAIDPIFAAMNLPITAPFSSVLSSALTSVYNLEVARGVLYLFGALITTSITFSMDLATGAWTASDWSATSLLDGARAANSGSLILGVTTGGTARLALSSTATADDNGTAITWHHQSGFYDLGSQGSKRTRQTVLWGSGSPTVSIFTDHGTTDSNAAAVTLGVAPAVARGWHRKAYRGVLLSHKLSGTTAATVHRIGHMVADERQGR